MASSSTQTQEEGRPEEGRPEEGTPEEGTLKGNQEDNKRGQKRKIVYKVRSDEDEKKKHHSQWIKTFGWDGAQMLYKQELEDEERAKANAEGFGVEDVKPEEPEELPEGALTPGRVKPPVFAKGPFLPGRVTSFIAASKNED